MRQPAYGQNTQPTEIGRESASLPINSPSQIPDAATLFHASSVSVRNEFCDLKVEFNAARTRYLDHRREHGCCFGGLLSENLCRWVNGRSVVL